MRAGIIKLSDLSNEMEMLVWGPSAERCTVKVGVPKEPKIVCEGKELGNNLSDRISGLIFGRRERASLEVPVLKENPVCDEVAVHERVGTNESLSSE